MDSKKLNKLKFEPYLVYDNNYQDIENFVELSEVAYGITHQLLFKTKDKKSIEKIPKPTNKEIYFCIADEVEQNTELVCGWLTFAEYAKHVNLKISTIRKKANEGKLGKIMIHPASKKKVILWPPEKQSYPLSKLPKPGSYEILGGGTVMANAKINYNPLDMSNFEKVQNNYLYLANSIGNPKKVTIHAKNMLFRSCFLLHWTIFEVFLRKTIQEMLRKHPSKIASGKRGKNSSINYEEITIMSSKFSSIDLLRENLVKNEIDRIESGDESISGLINFLNKEFKFKKSPYKAWYVLNGKRHITHYNDLKEMKEIRNIIVHNGGKVTNSFSSEHPNVSAKNGHIQISKDYYIKSKLILRSIAFLISLMIDKNEYKI